MKLLKNKRKEEIKELKQRVKELEEKDELYHERLRDYYDKIKDIEISYAKKDYNTKIKRKQEIEKICEKIENKIKFELEFSDDISIYVSNLLKLLQYLKEE